MDAPIVYFYSCVACGASGPEAKANGEPTTYACDVPQYGPFYCPKCRLGLVPADECAVVGRSVKLIGANPQADWCVLARDGDQVTLRMQGLPSSRPFQVSIGEIRPEFSWRKLEAAKRAEAAARLSRRNQARNGGRRAR